MISHFACIFNAWVRPPGMNRYHCHSPCRLSLVPERPPSPRALAGSRPGTSGRSVTAVRSLQWAPRGPTRVPHPGGRSTNHLPPSVGSRALQKKLPQSRGRLVAVLLAQTFGPTFKPPIPLACKAARRGSQGLKDKQRVLRS